MAQGKEYTLEFIQEELKSLLAALKADKEIVYIWELFTDKDYSRQRYSEWVEKYKEDETVKCTSDTIKWILETRAIKWAMTNKLNPTATIFHLKNNYKWVDKQEIDSNVNMKAEINNISELPTDELIKLANS